MYKFHNVNKRINWIHEIYASKGVSLPQFISSVNEAYYSSSADEYSNREIADIKAEYRRMFNFTKLKGAFDGALVIDIGGGIGFEYSLFLENNIKFRHFKYIEPSLDMARIFLNKHTSSFRGLVSHHVGMFSGIIDEISDEPHKVINSALHHVIWLEEMLADIKRAMQSGDRLIIGHEPNNQYPALMMSLQKILRAFFSNALLEKLVNLVRTTDVSVSRWDRINSRLVEEKITKGHMSPLLIRRIIDYGVGYKQDWLKLGIPPEYDEGHWSIHDLSKFFGADFDLVYYKTYRHLGDARGSKLLAFGNRLMGRFFTDYGSDLIAVWQKK